MREDLLATFVQSVYCFFEGGISAVAPTITGPKIDTINTIPSTASAVVNSNKVIQQVTQGEFYSLLDKYGVKQLIGQSVFMYIP